MKNPAAMSARMLAEPYWMAAVKWLAYRRRHSRQADRAVWRFVRTARACGPGSVFLDCGANVGDMSERFVRRGATVHAFEPDPVAADSLATRFAGRPNVHLHRVAVGASARRATLFRDPEGHPAGSSLHDRGDRFHDAAMAVEVIDLFDFVDGLGRPVDVLKLDVEGAEVEILERMLDERRWTQFGSVFVETHERFSPDHRQRLDVLRQRLREEAIANVDLDWP